LTVFYLHASPCVIVPAAYIAEKALKVCKLKVLCSKRCRQIRMAFEPKGKTKRKRKKEEEAGQVANNFLAVSY
jgi:hypothetical protein